MGVGGTVLAHEVRAQLHMLRPGVLGRGPRGSLPGGLVLLAELRDGVQT